MPNLLYLGKPEVTNQDVFKIMEEEDNTDTTVIAKIANTAKIQSYQGLNRNCENRRQSILF